MFTNFLKMLILFGKNYYLARIPHNTQPSNFNMDTWFFASGITKPKLSTEHND